MPSLGDAQGGPTIPGVEYGDHERPFRVVTLPSGLTFWVCLRCGAMVMETGPHEEWHAVERRLIGMAHPASHDGQSDG